MTTLREIRQAISDALDETTFFPRTNETYYPATWRYGEGAGGASTSTHYDRRIQLAAEHVAGEYELDMEGEFDDLTRARDAAALIRDRLRDQAAADEAEDAEDGE
jgi:hypothetical protein